MKILEVNGVQKIYSSRFGGNKVEALKNVSFSVISRIFLADFPVFLEIISESSSRNSLSVSSSIFISWDFLISQRFDAKNGSWSIIRVCGNISRFFPARNIIAPILAAVPMHTVRTGDFIVFMKS